MRSLVTSHGMWYVVCGVFVALCRLERAKEGVAMVSLSPCDAGMFIYLFSRRSSLDIPLVYSYPRWLQACWTVAVIRKLWNNSSLQQVRVPAEELCIGELAVTPQRVVFLDHHP